jgi:hypothetical protein
MQTECTPKPFEFEAVEERGGGRIRSQDDHIECGRTAAGRLDRVFG